MIHHGDCLDVMAAMEPESVDAIVTDPPYGLEFMGKEWDKLGPRGRHQGKERKGLIEEMGFKGFRDMPSFGSQTKNPKCETCGKYKWDHANRKCVCESPRFRNRHMGEEQEAFHRGWAEAAYRVAKPSAYLLAFGGTRTVHRMTVALEDAGWIIRDMLVWGYASGFPKSKASLKPAWEPIVMARKPGPLRMLAIDECRIPGPKGVPASLSTEGLHGFGTGGDMDRKSEQNGRWPANIVLTDPIFDGGWEGVVGGTSEQSGGGNPRWRSTEALDGSYHGNFAGGATGLEPSDTEGTYSRFFIIPKADRADREPVLGGLEKQRSAGVDNHGTKVKQCRVCGTRSNAVHLGRKYPDCDHDDWEWAERLPTAKKGTRANVHPTVKPTDLMRHLVRLVTPTGGTVLDPFLGSGTTALAAEMEGFDWVGIEREAEYVAIAEARLNGTQRGLGLEAS